MTTQTRRRASAQAAKVDSVAEQPNPDILTNATLLRKAKTRALLLYVELPAWAQDNEHILSGWRPETNSYWESIKSMVYIHNETGNIYPSCRSHLDDRAGHMVGTSHEETVSR